MENLNGWVKLKKKLKMDTRNCKCDASSRRLNEVFIYLLFLLSIDLMASFHCHVIKLVVYIIV
jgi:hypothetical protein